MSKTFRSPAQKHPATNKAPRIDVVQSDTPVLGSGGFTALWKSAGQQILAVTYWFDPVPHSGPYAVTVRFSGRRVDVKGRLHPGDRFVQDETIEEVIPGSGPISLTARVRDIHPGEWAVTAHILGSASSVGELREYENMNDAAVSLHPATRFWRRWAPSAETAELVSTCPTPFARVPGILPGIWGAMAALGIAVSLALQFLVISLDHLTIGPWLAVSLGAIVVGIAGAKVWYIVLYRREHSMNGWCIQGFITAAILTALVLLVAFDVPIGVFLDVITPGLLVAMAVGRVGCFFAGCCGGPPNGSRWGVWSSDQRVGARRIPTQLLELTLALSLGLGSLVAILVHGPARGALFIAAMATYTLMRQGILHLRTELRKTKYGGLVTAALAALVLVAALVLLAL